MPARLTTTNPGPRPLRDSLAEWVATLTVEQRTELLEAFTLEELRHCVACRAAREAITGESLADEIARLTAQADHATAVAFGDVTPCHADAVAAVRRIAAEMVEDGWPRELVAEAVVTRFDGWRALSYSNVVAAVAEGIEGAEGARRAA